ncbi:MAG: cob(I)yrinic acid a,c-diamide adenosyltransferase [Armatimonadetes bacterium]|nr:cob(I)yrinic acid a,c-diamide adenosyltransferase [Candidatus Hippobium faecium]
MGLIHIYTGDGKGKTTASLGLSLRALGWGKKVCMIQFLKGYSEIGEMKFAEKWDNFSLFQFCETKKRDIDENDVTARKKYAENALNFARNIVLSDEYDLIVLDEINCALHYDLINMWDVINLLKELKENYKCELVLTGRNAKPEIIALADYVTEMKCIKHPFEKGIPARKGIDY